MSLLHSTLKQALLTGGSVLKKGFAQSNRVMYKTPRSPVTEIDREAERRIISLIRKRFPDHGFLAEELAFSNQKKITRYQSSRYRWIIDPLDGTVNFIHGIPQACVSIGVECNGQIMAGGVCDPIKNELFLAARGKGATLNGRRIRVSPQRKLLHSLLITGFPYNRHRISAQLVALVEPVLRKGIDIRRFGAAALDLAWVACGRAEGFWEYNLNPWDVAAGLLLVEEAGGRVTDFRDRPINIDHPHETLATNGLIHRPLVSVFRRNLITL